MSNLNALERIIIAATGVMVLASSGCATSDKKRFGNWGPLERARVDLPTDEEWDSVFKNINLPWKKAESDNASKEAYPVSNLRMDESLNEKYNIKDVSSDVAFYLVFKLKYMDGSLLKEEKERDPKIREYEFKKKIGDIIQGMEKDDKNLKYEYDKYRILHPAWANEYDPYYTKKKRRSL